TGMVQRCVIVQKDEFGFGLTVSGDNPVFVQSVRKDGAAMRAGVQQGDRIIKVNGTLVTQSNHLEVVKLIKSGSYVALTLLGRPPGCPEPPPSLADARHDSLLSLVGSPGLSPDHNSSLLAGSRDSSSSSPGTNVSGIRLRPPAVAQFFFRQLFSHYPVSRVIESIIVDRAVNYLDNRISQLQCTRPLCPDTQTEQCWGLYQLIDDSSNDRFCCSTGGHHVSSLPTSCDSRIAVMADGFESVRVAPWIIACVWHHRRVVRDRQIPPCSAPPTTIFPQHSIIGPEDEDFPSDSEQADNQAVFARLERVKERPAHMAVFLQYVVSQHDPAPLMLNLMADAVLHSKEPRKMFASFYMLFLDRHAPLKVTLADSIQSEFDEAKNREDVPEATLGEARESVLRVIEEQLQDYRSKSEMGLGSFYGENELMSLSGDQMEERMAAEQLCAKLMDIIGKMEEDRRNAMVTVITTYMQGVGVKMKWARPVPSLERPPSSTDKRLFNILPNKKKPVPKKEKDLMKENDKKRFSLFQFVPRPSDSDDLERGVKHLHSVHYKNDEGGSRLTCAQIASHWLKSGLARASSNLCSQAFFRAPPRASRRSCRCPRVRCLPEAREQQAAPALCPSCPGWRAPRSTFTISRPSPPRPEWGPIPASRPATAPRRGSYRDTRLWTNRTWRTVRDDSFSRAAVPTVSTVQQLRDAEPAAPPRRFVAAEPDSGGALSLCRGAELFHTEKKHVQNLKVLYEVFFSRLAPVLTNNETYQIFINLDEILPIHESLNEAMRKIREKSQVVAEIGDLMLARFDGEAGEVLKAATAKFCSLQSQALDIVRSKQKKDPRFQQLMMEAESKPKCRRLQLKDFMLTEMQRLTKYPLLLQNILKYTQVRTVEHPDHKKLHKAGECCRRILNDVNETVRETENAQRLEDYQRRLDLSSLERSYNPLVTDFKNLDLTHKKMLYEGPLTWRVNKEKSIDLHVLLLEDLLVLLQKQDERLVLRCYSKTSAGTATDAKQTFSPVIKLGTVLVRPVATDKRAFFLITTSQLGPQIYELVAVTSKEMLIWQTQLEHAVEKEKQQEG
uniref:Rho guanine nucleotide exchange factor 11 n=1 Tax=Petromyzon marinus TaxID=7757 RepID=S4RCD7_PETMA